MAKYEAHSFVERVLQLLSGLPGAAGIKAQNELRRHFVRRAILQFEIIERTLGPGDVCLDLGANKGEITERLARTGATVHAFEPDPATFEVLKKQMSQFGNVVLHQNAVAAVSGVMDLYRVAEKKGLSDHNRSRGSSLLKSSKSSDTDVVKVEVRAFKDILDEIDTPIKFVKMDIEGAEVDIVKQIVGHPKEFAVEMIFVETHERQMPEQRADVMRLREAASHISSPDIHLFWP